MLAIVNIVNESCVIEVSMGDNLAELKPPAN